MDDLFRLLGAFGLLGDDFHDEGLVVIAAFGTSTAYQHSSKVVVEFRTAGG